MFCFPFLIVVVGGGGAIGAEPSLAPLLTLLVAFFVLE